MLQIIIICITIALIGGAIIGTSLLTRVNRVNVENMKVKIKVEDTFDCKGDVITTNGVAVITIKSEKESMLLMIEHFNTGTLEDTIGNIRSKARDVLESELRELLRKVSIEEVHIDRRKFENKVKELATSDLERMGLEIRSFIIKDIGSNKCKGWIDVK